MIQQIIGVLGLIISILPLLVLPFKVKAGISRYVLLYIFLILFYVSFLLYVFSYNSIFLIFLYIFEMLFFLNMYRSYLAKELLFSLPLLYYVNDLALIFSFYFTTFNLVELVKNRLNSTKVSIVAISSIFFFELAIIYQLMRIFSSQDYFSIIANTLFLIGTILFIIPALRVVRSS